MAVGALRLGNYEEITCCNCNTAFCMEVGLYKNRLDDHKLFYCPNGHPQHFMGEREVDRLKRQLEQKQREVEFEQRMKIDARRKLLGQKIATGKAKAARTRLLHRVECGVCPHCQRTFKQLAAHMKAKHADAKAKN